MISAEQMQQRVYSMAADTRERTFRWLDANGIMRDGSPTAQPSLSRAVVYELVLFNVEATMSNRMSESAGTILHWQPAWNVYMENYEARSAMRRLHGSVPQQIYNACVMRGQLLVETREGNPQRGVMCGTFMLCVERWITPPPNSSSALNAVKYWLMDCNSAQRHDLFYDTICRVDS